MIALSTSDVSLPLPNALVHAAVRHAERQAALTAAYLKASDLIVRVNGRLPAAFLLELAAVLELALWEQQDLRRHIDVDLPTYRQAADHLAARCSKGPEEFADLQAAQLSLQVLRVWAEHFAWDAPDLLGAEVVLSDVDDDYLDLLARFVWTHRNELAYIVLKD
ncbi:MAG: hypothetical protein GXX96_35430 [Planctomycetaceae bacterium]|nr:hypothetical protein [Planctomycetaceae bacterium]